MIILSCITSRISGKKELDIRDHNFWSLNYLSHELRLWPTRKISIFYRFWCHQPQGILGIHNHLNRFLLHSSSTHRWKCTMFTRDLNPWMDVRAFQPEMVQSINKPLLIPINYLYLSMHLSMLDSTEMYLYTHD